MAVLCTASDSHSWWLQGSMYHESPLLLGILGPLTMKRLMKMKSGYAELMDCQTISYAEQAVRGSAIGQSSGFVQTSKQNMIQFWDTVKQSNVFLPTVFIFLWQATPHSDSAIFYFTTNRIGFTPEFLGRVKLVTSVASLVGVGLHDGFLKSVPLRKIFLSTTLIGTTLGITQLRDWLDLFLNHSVPSSLVILSSLCVIWKLCPDEAVRATLSSLPDEVVDTVGITSLPSEDFLQKGRGSWTSLICRKNLSRRKKRERKKNW